jgi:hypothetical protein
VVLFLDRFLSFQEYVVQQLPAQYPTDGSFGKQTIVEVICFNFQMSQDLDELFLPTHAEPSVASFFGFASIRGSVANLLIYLADQLTRGFQSAHNQLQALQTQVTEIF